MAKSPKDKNLDKTKRIMERLVKSPPKPHDSGKKDKSQDRKSKKEKPAK